MRLGSLAELLSLAASLTACLDAPGGSPSDGAPPDGPTSLTVRRELYQALPDPGMIPDTLEVSDECTIAELTIDVSIVHCWRGDVELVIEGPTHRVARLKLGGDGDGDDDVVGNYPRTLTPVDSLDLYEGVTAKGPWILTVSDIAPGGTGIFQEWSLNVTCR